MSNRTPWRRNMIEGIVIVVSILLAFGIEASWEAKQENAAFSSLARLLRADIEADVAEMEERNARADTIVGALSGLIALERPGAELPPPDSLARLVWSSWSASSFTPSLSSFDVASTSAAWDRVPERVRVNLSEYTGGFTPFDLGLDAGAIEALIALAGEHGGIAALSGPVVDASRESDADLLAEFVQDPRVQSWLMLRRNVVRMERDWRVEWTGKLASAAEELLALSGSR